MKKHRKKLNKLNQLLVSLQHCNELRYQLLVDLQFHFENLDRINNTLVHQKKFAQEQAEKNIAFQQKESEIRAWVYEKIQEQMRIAEELSLYEQICYDRLIKGQEDYLIMLAMSTKEKELGEQIEEIKKAQQRFLQMLFDTIKDYQKQADFLTQKIILIDEKIALSKKRVAFLQREIKEIDSKIGECEARIIILDKKIENIDEEINESKDRILFLDQRIDQLNEEITVLDKRKEELRQERRQTLERTFTPTDQISRFNLSLIQSDDDRLMGLIHQVDLVRQGMAIIEIHHADIAKDLKIALAKEERVDDTVIEKEINHIVKKLLEKHHQEFLSEADFTYLINGLNYSDYYRKEVGKLISEIVQSQTIIQDLNSNLDAIGMTEKCQSIKIIEKSESEKERNQLSERQDQLKEDRLQASSDKEKVIEERDSLKNDKSIKEKEEEQENESQKVLEQQKAETTNKLNQVNAIKSSFEQVVQQEERQQKASMNQQEASISARDSIRELLARKRREKEMKDMEAKLSQSASVTKFTIFRGAEGKSEVDNKESVEKAKEKEKSPIDKNNPPDNSQDASNDSSFPEKRNKKLK